MPGLSLSVVALGSDPYMASLATVRVGDAALHLCRSSPFMGFAKTDADSVMLQLPLENADSLVLNGVPYQSRTVGVYGEGAEFLLASQKNSSYAAIILPSGLVGRLLEPPAESKLRQPGGQALLRASPESWEHARHVVSAVGEAIAAIPQVFDAEQARHALREALLQATRDLVSGKQDAEVRAPRSSKARRRIVMAADAYLLKHKDRPIYTEELCDVLGASASSLAEAFRAMFAISPHRFLKLRRLSMVRAALLSYEGAAPLVKSVALSHGFWHLGQFATDYRATFGELPSETLMRAGRWAAPEGTTDAV
ncbi:MAG: helix-turn-helix domain-containing protein [Geminicoccaceae bacterium]